MLPRALSAMLACCASILLFAGCDFFFGGPKIVLEAPALQDDFPPVSVTSPAADQPLRLTQAYLASQVAQTLPPMSIPLTPFPGIYVFPESRKPAQLLLNLDLHADQYNQLRVRMSATSGDRCEIRWHGETVHSSRINEPITAPIIADGEMHTYEIPLTGPYDTRWSGRIEDLTLTPSNLSAEVAIRSLELIFTPPDGARKASIAGQTHEVILGSPPDWNIIPQPNARFEAYVGLPEEGRATIQIEIERNGQDSEILLTKTTRPGTGYTPISADLSAYAGEAVTLRFSADVVPKRLASALRWGNPVVYSTDATPIPPVVLISIDTLRADHLSCYGHSNETTPHLDAFAREAILFENAVCQETYTLSSHMSMLTGLYPKNHSITPYTAFSEDRTTLVEALRDAGYFTAAFTGFNNWFKPEFGFAQGFDLYNIPQAVRRTVFETHDLANAWLQEANRPGPFLFLHNYDVHGYRGTLGRDTSLPYGPIDPAFLRFSSQLEFPETLKHYDPKYPKSDDFFQAVHSGRRTLSDEELVYIRALYDDAILSVDKAINDIFETLKARGLYDSALIIVTSDHGESLGETTPADRQLYGHGWVYQESANVPLIVKLPQGRLGGTRYPGVVQTIDIAPTILDVLGLDPLPEADGISLLALVEGRVDAAPYAYTQRQLGRSVRDESWKLIVNTNDQHTELFNMPKDPIEMDDLYPRAATALAQQKSSDEAAALTELELEMQRHYSSGEEGWHVYWLRNGPEENTMHLSISSEEPFTDMRFLRGDRLEYLNHTRATKYITRTDRSFTIDLGRIGDEKIHLKTSSPLTTLQISIEGGAPVRIALGNSAPEALAQWRSVLKSTDALTDTPGELPEQSEDEPLLVIQYVKPEDLVVDETILSEEDLEELKALGYLE